MINLLPHEAKSEIQAGRANRLIIRYMILLGILSVVLFTELAYGYLSIHSRKVEADKQIQENQSNTATLADATKKVNQFNSDLATAKKILDKQINYSSIILKVSSVIPPGVIIEQLSLDPAEFDKPTTIQAKAVDDNAAIQLKTAMSESTYFSNPHFETVATGNGSYPLSISMTVTFTKELLKDE